MSVTVFHHPDIFLHDAAANHVAMERTRIQQIYVAVSQVPDVELCLARAATREEFERVHPAKYVDLLAKTESLRDGEVKAFNRETVLNRHSFRAMTLSAGAVCEAVEHALEARSNNAFCVGYAGHHAFADRPSGFCFTNQIAIGARHAMALGAKRIAVLDFDTHAGNGTILSLIDEERRILFAETYQKGFPGSFMPGYHPAHIRRRRTEKDSDWIQGWYSLLEDVHAYRPELVLVSAGFDAHLADPLSAISLSDSAYSWMGWQLSQFNAPVVATLEGGYSVTDTARCAALFVSELNAKGRS